MKRSAIKACFAAMFAHGIEPRQLANVRPETIAIISDLIRWDGHDPHMKDSTSPVPQVVEIYRSRLLLTPGQLGSGARSVPEPLTGRLSKGSNFYVFDHLVPAASNVSQAADIAASKESPTEVKSTNVEGDEPAYAMPQAAPATPTGNDVAGVAEPIEDGHAMTPTRAKIYAEFLADNHRFQVALYWPKDGVTRDDYEPDRLAPALEKWIASGGAWSGAEAFLVAVRQGQGREFIAERRAMAIARLTPLLLNGDKHTVDDARSLGLEV
jgi:hypothetical protein